MTSTLIRVAVLLASSAWAQEPYQEDLPDNSAAFRKKPYGDNTPFVQQQLAQDNAEEMVEPERRLVGTVLGMSGDQLWLRADGINIPFTVTPNTEVSEGTLLIPGEDVRTTFRADAAENVVLALEPVPAPPSPDPPQPLDIDLLEHPLVPDTGTTRGAGSPVPRR